MAFRKSICRIRVIVPCLLLVMCLCVVQIILHVGRFRLPTGHNTNTQTSHYESKTRAVTVHTGEITPKPNQRWAVTPTCQPMFDPSGIDKPFKFYIYDLPPKFNTEKVQCLKDKRYDDCYDLSFCGMGKELFNYSNKGAPPPYKEETSVKRGFTVSVRNTHMFALEVVMHYKLLHSPYRTLDARKADLFYIPAYSGLASLCKPESSGEFVEELFQYLNKNSTYFAENRPHFASLGKIQREQREMMQHPDSKKVTFIGIEQEWTIYWLFTQSLIVAPYPSYVHFAESRDNTDLLEYKQGLRHLNQSHFKLDVPTVRDRNVLLFFAASTRRSNLFRAQIIDQFPIQTAKGVDEYFKKAVENVPQIMLITWECRPEHRLTTIPWMSRSTFCLQPEGDSPTRKSFYDAILSGCIPVIFKYKAQNMYPFQNRLNYKDFTYEINVSGMGNTSVIDIIKEIPKARVETLHKNLLRVAKWFQYSLPDGGPDITDDAVTLLLDEVRRKYDLNGE